MPPPARPDEAGYTLAEILVVILLIGILAAIAVPTFLGQQRKGQDSAAKADARNAVSQVESCAAAAGGGERSALGCGSYPGKPSTVRVDVTDADAYSVVATSASGHTFSIARSADGAVRRSCTGTGGGCKDSTW